AQQTADGGRSGRDAQNADAGKQLLIFLAAHIRHQGHDIAAREQLLAKRASGKDMPARSAARQNDMPRLCHLSSPVPGRRRLSARTMPISSASANIEEPP